MLAGLLFTAPMSSAFAETLHPVIDPTNPDRPTNVPKSIRAEKIEPVAEPTQRKAPFIMLAGQRLVSYLTNLRSAIEGTKDLSDDQRTSIVKSINESISFIQTQTITANNAKTDTEINHQVAAIKNYWLDKQNTVTYYLGLITGSGIRRTIDRFHAIEDKFSALFQRFQPSQDLIDLNKQFTDEVKAAEDSYTKARDAFEQIKTPGDHKDLFTNGLQAFHEAHQHLRDARKLSREIITKLRSALGVKPPSPTSTPDVQP